MEQRKFLTVFTLLLLVLSLAILPAAAQDDSEEMMEEPGYGMPEGYEVSTGGTGAVTFESESDTIIITTAADYAAVISSQEFESDFEEISFFVDRIGYAPGTNELGVLASGAVSGVGIANSRTGQQGVAYLYDLGRERFAVLSLHEGRGQVGAPVADVETVVSGFTFLGTIVDIALENAAGGNEDRAGLSYLVAALQNADDSVLETLAGEGNYTVFAPTNQAFINLFAYLEAEYDISATDLLADENQALLTQVLLYHVVEGDVFAADVAGLESGSSVGTLLGDEQNAIVISFSSDGAPRLNGTVDLIATDILASNGVIHIIDDVLLPQCVIDTLEGTGACEYEAAEETDS